MNKLLVASLLLFCNMASAEPVPVALQKNLSAYDEQEITLKDHALRIVMNRPIIRFDMYSSLITAAVCAPLWLDHKQGWGNAKIERIEVVNSVQGQGFAFVGGRKACNEIGNMPHEESLKYIRNNAWVCVAGFPCRPRNPGEKISGD